MDRYISLCKANLFVLCYRLRVFTDNDGIQSFEYGNGNHTFTSKLGKITAKSRQIENFEIFFKGGI